LKSKVSSAQAALEQAKAQEGLLTQGPDRSDVEEAYAQVEQAQDDLRLLTQGARSDEVTQAQAKVQEAKTRYVSLKSSLDNSAQMLKEGIISQQKYNDIQGQVVAAQGALESAQAGLKRLKSGAEPEQIQMAKARLEAAKAQYQKVLKGAKPGQIQIASAGVQQAESALTSLKAQLIETTVTAPIAGVVSVLSVNPGELISPNRPVVSIIDDANLWTDVYVPENRLDIIRVGQTVEVSSPVYKHALFQGKVVAINPKSEFIPGGNSDSSGEESSFRVKISLNPVSEHGSEQLHPGMRVNVVFHN
jgi:multidrug resistance efflux pump